MRGGQGRAFLRFVLKLVFSALLVFSGGYDSWVMGHANGLPFSIQLQDRHSLVIGVTPGVPLPAPLQEGDRIELSRLDFDSRVLFNLLYNGRTVPENATYTLPFTRGSQTFDAPVTTVPLPGTDVLDLIVAVSGFIALIVSIFGLLMIWRGRDRAAAGLALWCLGFNLGIAFNAMPIGGVLGIGLLSVGNCLFLLSRTGFFLMAESLVSPVFSPRLRAVGRMAFGLMLLLGGLQVVGSMVYFASTGDAEWMLPRYSVFFSWIYLVPLVMLLAGYARSRSGERVRLAWVAAAALLIMASVTLVNAIPIGFFYTYSIAAILLALALFALSYALLRHRLVAIAIVVDRALVYGLVTTLVVGVVAAVNSLALRAALPPGASLAVQIMVPLALGIALRQVKEYLDRIVERVFFRAKYLSEKALRSFAQHVEHFTDAAALLEAATSEVQRHTQAPGVAVYSVETSGYKLMQQVGGDRFPRKLNPDDAALVAVRAERREVELADHAGALGEDGCVFPMIVLGTLRGVIVCRNRPGEHFGTDERKLLSDVAREVGAAWRILRARDNEAYVALMADGELTLKAARDKARALAVAWG
jgi:hypothetical protein